MSTRPVIVAEGLGKRFKGVQALSNVDLEVPTGNVIGLLGPNGAGKTTMVRMLTTLLVPDAGRAEVLGYDVVRQADAVRRVIGLTGQYAAVDAYLTGRENLRMIGQLSGLNRRGARRRSDELIELFDLTDAAHRVARTYSGGMRRRLDIAASLVGRPAVLFLDEPTTGLDPRGRLDLWKLLEDLAAEGVSMLMTTQYLEEADRLADRIVVIDGGRVIASGTASELKSRVGGDRLELQVPSGEDPQRLADALAELGSGPPVVDVELGRVSIPIADSAGILPEISERLEAAKVGVADFALRHATLDDVFLALTGAGRKEDREQRHDS
jgi:daunorubicin resistance ABC transporter ATP-binding subunit